MVRWLGILLADISLSGSHEPRVGAGEPRASAAARRVEGAPAAATADGAGPDLLGRAVQALEELAEFPADGAAGDRGEVAPAGVPALLGVEESTPMRSAHDRDGAPRLIRRMSHANPLWGAPRIHGELQKLGLTVSQATVSKYMLRPRRPPSQAWRTFLKNHAKDLIALDFFTVPTATFRVLFVLVVLSHDRRRLVHFNVTEHPTAEWTARQLRRGLRAGGDATVSDPGPRPGLWRTIFASGPDVGHPGSGHRATLAVAKRLCRAGDWIDSTGMP